LLTERLHEHRCDGFMAFYSKRPSASLARRLEALKTAHQLLVLDCEAIERRLLADAEGQLLASRFFPASFAAWKRTEGGGAVAVHGGDEDSIERQPSDQLVERRSRTGNTETFSDFEKAKAQIYQDISTSSGYIKIFMYTGSSEINMKGSLFAALEHAVLRGDSEIMILNASASSPNFNRDRLLGMRKKPKKIAWAIESANRAFEELQSQAGEKLKRRSHLLPFVWRIYLTSHQAYFMPYLTDSRAFETSPVQVYVRGRDSMYDVLERWFDYTWEQSEPAHVAISEIAPPTVPSGSSLFLQWEGKHVFGVSKRSFWNGSAPARFSGIGGKRKSAAESIEACAVREAQEELGSAFACLTPASETMFIRRDGSVLTLSIADVRTKPRLVFERPNLSDASGLPRASDSYVLVAFDGLLRETPLPRGELAATLLIPDDTLKMFLDRTSVSAADLRAGGAEVLHQEDCPIRDDRLFAPHGTASFLVRNLGLGAVPDQ
jgi:8-oxo-dGTP pyrophosphatase MutT (NUDIX family)/ribosomal protein L24E